MVVERKRTVLRLLGIGWYVALCILGGGCGGYYLDLWLHLKPIMTLLGLGFGIFIAVIGMYKMLLAVLNGSYNPSEESGG